MIFEYFKGGDPETWRRTRYHLEVGEIEQYKNNWDLLKKALDEEAKHEGWCSGVLDIHVIMDNYGTHKTALMRNWFAKRPAFMRTSLRPTVRGSIWWSAGLRSFTNKQLRRGSHRSVRELELAIREFLEGHNDAPHPFVWTKTADEILTSIAGFAQRTLETHPTLIERTIGTGH